MFFFNIGKETAIHTTITPPITPNTILAIKVSPIVLDIFLLSSLTFTIFLVADNINPKSTKICIYVIIVFTYATVPYASVDNILVKYGRVTIGNNILVILNIIKLVVFFNN